MTESATQRYLRHLQLPGFGAAGQRALDKASVLIVGLGGLGCPAAQYLAAAGVGQLTLLDDDKVSLSNLQRQVLFTELDIGRRKADVAADRLRALNSDIAIVADPRRLHIEIAPTLIASHDLVLDCSDNFHTRYLINDVCHGIGTPWVYASVLGFNGQLALFCPGEACFRCVFPELAETPDCNQAGVLGALPGTLGSLQALLAIGHLAAIEPRPPARITQVDGLTLNTRHINLSRDPDCVLCSGRATYRELGGDYAPALAVLPEQYVLAATDLEQFCIEQQPLLIDVRGAEEHAAHNIGGINLPLDTWPEALEALPPSDGGYLLYCQSGLRSGRGLLQLRDRGLTLLKSLAGGLDALP